MFISLPILLTTLALSQAPEPAPAPVPSEAVEDGLPDLDDLAPPLTVTRPVEETPVHPCAGKPLYSVRLSG